MAMTRRRDPSRPVLAALVLCLAAAALCFLFLTPEGAAVRRDPYAFREAASRWVANHPVAAPLVIVVLYVFAALSATPVWWIQVLAGAAFGLTWGVVWCQAAGTIAGVVTFLVSRHLAADYFHARIEARSEKLRRLDERVGRNGLLVVAVARLAHVVPFGLSYYMFGLTTITAAEVVLGTLLGYLPTVLLFVRAGSDPRGVVAPTFLVSLACVYAVLLVPLYLLLRHRRLTVPAAATP